MIRRVTVRRFKRFGEQVFELGDSIVLSGANNSGKTTLLQAIATWKFGLDRWREQRSGGKATLRTGVSVTRDRFTPVPLREMNLLWEQRRVTLGAGRTSRPRLIEVELEGEEVSGCWKCGMEFQYANPELLYIRPLGARDMDSGALHAFPPAEAVGLDVVHVPALAGIAREEPRHERGMQDLLVGMGRPGEILRNLLWEISRNEEDWRLLREHIHDVFGVEIRSPEYSPAQPHIVCEYRDRDRQRPLDISNAGSGMLQVLLLFAFFYARRGSVLLLDEPDAHQHVVLQRQVCRRIRRAAEERDAQLIVATHSEVLLDATAPSAVIGFFGAGPRALATPQERDRLRYALRRLTTTELLRASESGSILYVEGRSDEAMLREWAGVLKHPAQQFFARANVHWLRGRNLADARSHFAALRIEFPDLPGICLLDGDNRDEPEEDTSQTGLAVLRWDRYEIENYLLQPAAIERFVKGPIQSRLTVRQEFERQIPAGADLFGDIPALVRVKASDELLLPMLDLAGKRVKKTDLHQLAAMMQPDEIHPEVRSKLDRIASELLPGGEG